MKITTLVIHHKHGVNVYPCASPEIADAYLYDYIVSWWADAYGDEPIPDDDAQAIEQYFDVSQDEYYEFFTEPLLESLPTREVAK